VLPDRFSEALGLWRELRLIDLRSTIQSERMMFRYRSDSALITAAFELLHLAPDSNIMLLLWVTRQIGKIAVKFSLLLALFARGPERVKIRFAKSKVFGTSNRVP
jgi:hypothetical protein